MALTVPMASTNPARRWALATASLLTQTNGQDHALLGGGLPGPQAAKDRLEVLKRDWDAGTREELLKALGDLARAGHRKLYDEASALDAAASAKVSPGGSVAAKIDDDTVARMNFVRAHRHRIGNKSVLAWDAGRLVTIAGWGYVAGLLSEDEAWSWILPMAQAVQRTYASWEEYGVHYMLGHEMWSGAWDAELARCNLALLDGPQAVWRQVPWNTDLNQHGLGVPLQTIVIEAPPQPVAPQPAAPPKRGPNVAAIVAGAVVVLILAGVGVSYALGLFGSSAAKPAASVPTASAVAVTTATASAPAPVPTHATAPAPAHPGGAAGPKHSPPAPSHSAPGGKPH